MANRFASGRARQAQRDAYSKAMGGKTVCPRSAGNQADCPTCGSRGFYMADEVRRVPAEPCKRVGS